MLRLPLQLVFPAPVVGLSAQYLDPVLKGFGLLRSIHWGTDAILIHYHDDPGYYNPVIGWSLIS